MDRPDETGSGAGPTRGREATRARILASARELFTDEGYGSVSSRMIASHAGVNVALINRYFGAKRGLLTEILREDGVFPGLIEGDHGTLTRRLAEHAVSRLHGEGTALQRALDDSAGDPDLQAVYQGRITTAMIDPLSAYLGGEGERSHASLVAAVMLGLSRVRLVEGATALRALDRERLTARIQALLDLCLEDFGDPGA
ncbi:MULTISPECIES: TetR/AcrR family transcriptional regulator [Nocardiopsidaceae]|uniref:TetR family transcriptional regulator n=2 Tax=Nocardiopsidaceae TaxID=83676 RepID=A0ABY6YNY2_9ACTN|nr:TetR/AcrR family transcriptional regulator [Streptomonospora nanhaiensis]MEE2047087.1 TetR family transcriptional regulator [Nocardiopsis tropica]WAE73882.1 TetR family transcriptional regulator [Streptomonospora nanhaiensis]